MGFNLIYWTSMNDKYLFGQLEKSGKVVVFPRGYGEVGV